MGFGDVKAGLVLGAALGLVDAQLGLFALVLGLGTGALWGLTRRARSIPLGPALVAGALTALAVGRLLGTEVP
jgi:prepilin signal peptidase PulO-like enzyme (type II secretory pathway)